MKCWMHGTSSWCVWHRMAHKEINMHFYTLHHSIKLNRLIFKWGAKNINDSLNIHLKYSDNHNIDSECVALKPNGI